MIEVDAVLGLPGEHRRLPVRRGGLHPLRLLAAGDRQALRAIDTHKLLLFAEGTRKDSFTAGFQLEYGMSFYTNMVSRIFGTHQSVRSIDTLNTTEYREATGDDQVVRYISNHDVDQSEGAPVTLLGGKPGSLAAFVVAAYMKGVPMIYNGQEVGCPTKLSFFDKSTPIDWSINSDLAGEYQRIIGLRNGSNAIKRGDLQSFSTDDVCAFAKSREAEEILVIVNLRNTPSAFNLPDHPAWRALERCLYRCGCRRTRAR